MLSIDLAIRIILALIMLGVGMSINLRDFKAIVRRPKALGVGLVSQMVALPVFAILLVWWSPLSSEFKMGIIILSLCPGGNMSNYISYLTKANTALAISLTTINGLLTVFTIPLVSNWAALSLLEQEEHFSLPFLATALEIFLLILFPAAIGVFIRYYRISLTEKLESPIKWATYILMVMVFGIFALGKENQGGLQIEMAEIWQIIPFALLLNFFGLLFGYFFGGWNKLSKRNAITLSIETGLQNTALALLIATSLIGNANMAKPAFIYAAFSFWTTLGFAYFMKNKKTVSKKLNS